MTVVRAIHHESMQQLAYLIVNTAPVKAKGFKIGKRLSTQCILVAYEKFHNMLGFKSLNELAQLLDNYSQFVI
jgi:hypothetical protein